MLISKRGGRKNGAGSSTAIAGVELLGLESEESGNSLRRDLESFR